MRALSGWPAPVAACLYVLLAGLALVPWPGLQNDELFFSGPLFAPVSGFFNVEIGAAKIPLMVMSYTGALKTWLYAALFQVVAPGVWSVRIPVILMGMGTVWLTWVWVGSIAGRRAAWIATALLATDTMFLMTGTFDWGPVAIQHLALMGGLAAFEGWRRGHSRRALALAFFLWGVGMWDKALLAWPLGGLAAACLAVYPRQSLRRLRPTAAGIALASFLVGASPLVWYNIARPGETATTNAKFALSEVSLKTAILRTTVNGSALFGYMVDRRAGPVSQARASGVARASAAVRRVFGPRPTNWMAEGLALAAMCGVFLWRRPEGRMLLFLAVAMAVEWLQMAVTTNAGGGSHHVVLLWPFPMAFMGIAFAAAAARLPGRAGLPLLALVTGGLVVGNILNTNEYLAEFASNGGAGGWTDAIYPLESALEGTRAKSFGMVDWGYLNGIRLLGEGDLPLFVASDPVMGTSPTEAERAELQRMMSDQGNLFIQHTDDKQLFTGVNGRFRQAAAELGYTERVERTIADRNGRPVFELFRMQHR